MELLRVFFKNINIGLQEIGRRIAIEQWQQLPYDKVAPRIKFKTFVSEVIRKTTKVKKFCDQITLYIFIRLTIRILDSQIVSCTSNFFKYPMF